MAWTHKIVLMATAASLIGATAVSAEDAAPPAANLYVQRGAATPARAALQTSVPELNVDGMALGRVIEYMRDVTGCNLVVNWKVLEGANVTKDAPITLNVRDLPMRKLLRLVLDQASPSTPLTWTIDSNVISITTEQEADKVLITRVYVVDDLVMTDNETSKPPSFNLQTITQNGQSGGSAGTGTGGATGGGGQGIFTDTNSANNVPQQTSQQKGEELAKLIENVIRPDIWRDNGGTCSLRYFSGKLIVTAPESVQQMIGGVALPEGGVRLGM